MLLAIADYADDAGLAWPLRETLCEKARVSQRHLTRCLDEARERGELEIRGGRAGRSSRNVYRILLGGLADVEVDMSRLPFELSEPFRPGGHLDHVSPGSGGHPVAVQVDTMATSCPRDCGSEPSGEPSTTVSDGRGDAPATAQELTAFYVDECRRRGADPPRRVIGQVAKRVATLLGERFAPTLVCSGLATLVDKGLNPSALDSCVHEAQIRTAPRRRGETDARFAGYDD